MPARHPSRGDGPRSGVEQIWLGFLTRVRGQCFPSASTGQSNSRSSVLYTARSPQPLCCALVIWPPELEISVSVGLCTHDVHPLWV